MHRLARLGLASLLALSHVGFAACPAIWTRVEGRSLAAAQKTAFWNAMRKAMASGVVDAFAAKHYQYKSQTHGTYLLLTWHRAYIRDFEMELQKYDPSVSLPYWAWEMDSAYPLGSTVLTDFGGVSVSGCVSSTLLGGWRPRSSGACLKRLWSSYPVYSSSAITAIVRGATSYDTFRQRLESPPHGNIHMMIGGDMSTMYAPNDPLYWVHHANVDRFWAMFQAYWSAAGPLMGYPGPLDTAMPGVTATARSVLDTKALCYVYN
jgi:tyrosinase